ncbi:MAG TPA: hypothetical protein V6D25_20295 [Leptolyngbyaceae cyanobacterium]
MGTVIDSIGDRQMQNNITASTAILAGLVLEQEVIQRLPKTARRLTSHPLGECR